MLMKLISIIGSLGISFISLSCLSVYKCPFFTLSTNVNTHITPAANAKPNICKECISIKLIFLPYQNRYLTYLFFTCTN